MTTPVARSGAATTAASPFGWLTQQGLRGMARREALIGYLFILPTYFGFLLFVLGPIASERTSVAPANPAVNKAGVEGPELLVAPAA